MAEKVTCTTKDSESNYDDCRCIETLGTASDNSYSRIQAYRKVNNNSEALYVETENGGKTYLEANKRDGTKYVRTEPNDTEDDNLLKLPSCPN